MWTECRRSWISNPKLIDLYCGYFIYTSMIGDSMTTIQILNELTASYDDETLEMEKMSAQKGTYVYTCNMGNNSSLCCM